MKRAKFKLKEVKLTQLKQLKATPSETGIVVVGSLKKIQGFKVSSIVESQLAKTVESFIKLKKSELKDGQILELKRRSADEMDVTLAILPAQFVAFECLDFCKRVLKSSISPELKSLQIAYLESSKNDSEFMDCLGSALAARLFLMPRFGKKLKEQKEFKLSEVVMASQKKFQKDFHRGFEAGEGSNLVRHLGFLPPNILTAKAYGDEIKKLCRSHKIQVKFYSREQLKKMGAGAFTAVDQADPESSGGIYELTYSPTRSKNKKPVVLVGKGLCYDTGGYDIKTGGYMAAMKGDMQGSAVALSSLLTCARLKLPLKIKAYLGVTENHISPKGYKADDVVVALNGKSIEVVNTDAEGRMVLADTLCLATKSTPDLCIDYATLTGMAVYSIGTKYSCGFTNEDRLHSKIVEAGKVSGERVWTFPLDEDYGKNLESPIADTLQCSRARGIDHILAAYFLKGFVKEGTPWVHIDLSAAENKGGLAHTDSEFTGFGVRWTLEFLRQKYKV